MRDRDRRVQVAEGRANTAERRATDAERRATDAERTLRDVIEDHDRRVQVAEGRANTAERRAADAERRATDAERTLRDAMRRVQAAEGRANTAERRVTEATDRMLRENVEECDRRVQAAEGRANTAERRATDAEGTLRDAIEDCGRRVEAAEGRTNTADRRANAAERRAADAERLLSETMEGCNMRVQVAEGRANAAEKRVTGATDAEMILTETMEESDRRVQVAEDRANTAERRATDAERTLRDAMRRVQAAEGRANTAERRATDATDAGRIILGEAMEECDRRVQAAEGRANTAERRAADAERRAGDVERTLRDAMGDRRVQEAERRATRLTLNEDSLRKLQQQDALWVVERREIQLTGPELGRGGWATVSVATFRGVRVAAKCIHNQIVSRYNIRLFQREMDMAAKIRHPNLVQFIGATIEGEMVILMELMPTSLRKELESQRQHNLMPQEQVTSIAGEVARALNYLHLMKPHPFIHRDINSANILLEALPKGRWRAKVSDFGTVNLLQELLTVNPGTPAYAAPEAGDVTKQSPKMDIFSFGVLLVEMLTGEFPDTNERRRQLFQLFHNPLMALIERCLSHERKNRPSARHIISELDSCCVTRV